MHSVRHWRLVFDFSYKIYIQYKKSKSTVVSRLAVAAQELVSESVNEALSARIDLTTLDLVVQPTSGELEPEFETAIALYTQLCSETPAFKATLRRLRHQAVLQPLRKARCGAFNIDFAALLTFWL